MAPFRPVGIRAPQRIPFRSLLQWLGVRRHRQQWHQHRPPSALGATRQEPQKGYLKWVLTGRKPMEKVGDEIALYRAIVAKESSAVNPHTGALGLGQVMPQNLDCSWDGTADKNCGWDYDVLGKDVTPQEFLASPEIQQQIVGAKLEAAFHTQLQATGHNTTEAVRRTAAEWYSGDPNKANDTSPQANGYESIKSYADTILSLAGWCGRGDSREFSLSRLGCWLHDH
jgi:hypothetical protein